MKIFLGMISRYDLDVMDSLEYPLGLLSIAAFVRNKHPDWTIKILYGNITGQDILSFSPDIIGLSVQSPFFTMGQNLVHEVRRVLPPVPVIIGGHHITYLPGELPRDATAGVVGEGERVFLRICEAFHRSGGLTTAALSAISGIVFWDNGSIRQTEANTDLLSPAEFPLIDTYELCGFTYRKPILFHIMTSRGCPYRCRFCSSSPFWRTVRYQSAESVVKQISYIVNTFHPGHIHIFDDLMIANKGRLTSIRDMVVSQGLHRKVDFSCWVSGIHFDRETALLLKDMNVTTVNFAVESGSARIYEYLKGTWNNPQKNRDAIRFAHGQGFRIGISVIVGSPDETVGEMQITHDFIKNLPIDTGTVALLKPYPGTVIWEEAKQRGIVHDSMDDWHVIELNDLSNPRTLLLAETSSRSEVMAYYVKNTKLLKHKERVSSWKHRLSLCVHPVAAMRRIRSKALGRK
jgi:anaerobic magnesium-protoporphyrin IX monomethyl ester cyclase